MILRRAAAALCLGMLSWAVQAQPAPASAHATRTGAAFAALEESLLQAQRARQTDVLERLLGEDFQMVIAQDGGATVPREDWLDSAARPGAGAWVVSQLSTHAFGDKLAVVAFVLRGSPARAGAVPLSVVDTWTRPDAASDTWRLALRHVASAAGPRKGIPGDAPTRAVIKKY